MKLSKFRLKSGVKAALAGLLLFSAIGFVEKKQHDKVCHEIIINIENQFDNYFIDQKDILHLMTNRGYEKIIGTTLGDLELKAIENRIRAHKYIQNAEVYKDLRGNVIVNAVQAQPIARVVQPDGPDAYIGRKGQILPTSERFTARVIVIDGAYASELVKQDLTKTKEGKAIFELLNYILANKFWSAQIAELKIDHKGYIVMYPQVSKQYVEFGKAEDIEEKFKKLHIFYTKILPMNWNAYERVDLKYENQIICE